MIRHVTVYREAGRFGGWPANGGMWAWGDELLVGLRRGYMNLEGGFHAIDRTRSADWAQARSLDGGETWRLEDPVFPAPEGEPDASASVGLSEPVDLEHPNLAIKFCMSGLRAGARSWFYYSYDRGHSWSPPCLFPTLGLLGISARTDYVALEDGSYLFFLTAAKTNGDEGRVFCARTTDGCRTFSFVSWAGSEPAGWTIMPASVRLPGGRILSALRCRDGNPDPKAAYHWIDLYASDDQGKTWIYLARPVQETGLGGNAPTLNRLRDGRLLIIYGFRNAPFGMRAVIGDDQGITWSQPIIIREDGGCHDIGYPRTVVRPDGMVVTVYYYNDHADGERYIAASLWEPA